ncbi:hypothetical protein AVEN_215938-1 [Araneus ventricosus]|uniref:Uncharacterized protein n=1 Tax=Araneus ventricosus TaxID=182803 RepID=A0A4Y2HH91_ARAVE|nr:hypothetical protein AVEN_215938-1 [Araneus ventricosus]
MVEYPITSQTWCLTFMPKGVSRWSDDPTHGENRGCVATLRANHIHPSDLPSKNNTSTHTTNRRCPAKSPPLSLNFPRKGMVRGKNDSIPISLWSSWVKAMHSLFRQPASESEEMGEERQIELSEAGETLPGKTLLFHFLPKAS